MLTVENEITTRTLMATRVLMAMASEAITAALMDREPCQMDPTVAGALLCSRVGQLQRAAVAALEEYLVTVESIPFHEAQRAVQFGIASYHLEPGEVEALRVMGFDPFPKHE